jgi:hypothetical protein
MVEKWPRVLATLAAGSLLLGAAALASWLVPVRTFVEASANECVPAATAVADTLPLPCWSAGLSRAEVEAAFGPGTNARLVSAGTLAGTDVWEWSEPAGRYALAEFAGGRLVSASVRRPWVGLLPAVEASRLPALRDGASRASIERFLGPGWPIEREFGRLSAAGLETRAWAIRDRGVGTGAILKIRFRGDVAAGISHPWVRS